MDQDSIPSTVARVQVNNDGCWCCREGLVSKVASLQAECDASRREVVAAHASEADLHASMAAQQSDMHQLQAELSTVTAAR